MDFKALKARRKEGKTSLNSILKDIGQSGSSRKADPRIFKPTMDKDKHIGLAIVRFLPNKHNDKLPIAKQFSHYFKGKAGWYNELARSTIEENDDPVYETNVLLYGTGNKKDEDLAKERGRKIKFFANVYVIKDTINPENEGKVMIYEFGNQIYKKLESAIDPEFEGDPSIDIYDMWEKGANLRLKVKGKKIPKRGGGMQMVPNYEDSIFETQSSLFDGDDELIEEQYNKTYDLSEFVKPEIVKSRDELIKIFLRAIGEKDFPKYCDKISGESTQQEQKEDDKLPSENAGDMMEEPEPSKSDEQKEPEPSKSDEDDSMAFFKKLAG